VAGALRVRSRNLLLCSLRIREYNRPHTRDVSAFLALLLARGAPVGLMIFSFACFANLAAGLTNYGTTPSPMFFAQDYVSMKTWWRIGFIVSLVNIAIWTTVGFGWWRFVGVW
jgi:divalent anion:Na+ symporter, DASS family